MTNANVSSAVAVDEGQTNYRTTDICHTNRKIADCWHDGLSRSDACFRRQLSPSPFAFRHLCTSYGDFWVLQEATFSRPRYTRRGVLLSSKPVGLFRRVLLALAGAVTIQVSSMKKTTYGASRCRSVVGRCRGFAAWLKYSVRVSEMYR